MILLIDNTDSFVYNLARYIGELGFPRIVKRNYEISIEDIRSLNPTHIIISPGPCSPNEAGVSLDTIRHFGKTTPILGVCLGHQAIGQAYGATVTRALKPMHGKSAVITHNNLGIFKNITNPLKVARYHSLIVKDDSSDLEYTAFSEEGEVMALQHRTHPVYGVQFHPESVLTVQGYDLLQNFLTLTTQTA